MAKSYSLICLSLCLLGQASPLFGQADTAMSTRSFDKVATRIAAEGLGSGKAYELLFELCTKIGARLTGSSQASEAVKWTEKKMEDFGLENVRLEAVKVPHWERGSEESARILESPSIGTVQLRICALGGSVPTTGAGIVGEVLEVKSFEELKHAGGKAKGKIVFFNRAMDRSMTNTFEAYGGSVDQRSQGPIEAAKSGSIAALVRSMTTRLDDVPHTGATHYVDSVPQIPAAAVSTVGADLLSELIAKEKTVKLFLKLTCQMLPDVESSNVVGELTGYEKPGEVVLVGGHLDSWDKGQGAHDDGAGCIQAIEALRLLKQLGIRPKRTIRVVLFMNEEFGLSGGIAYAGRLRDDLRHIAAIESDAGGFSPRGFGVSADSAVIARISQWNRLLEPIGADRIEKGGGGADISPLSVIGIPTIGLRVDSQRYFDYHHSDNDTIDTVNERELELGAIAMAILAYLIAEQGI